MEYDKDTADLFTQEMQDEGRDALHDEFSREGECIVCLQPRLLNGSQACEGCADFDSGMGGTVLALINS